jgi:hypothetical protein
MALMTFKPTSPGRRSMVRVVTPGLHKGAPHAALVEKQGKSGGRNHHGRITTRHIGGGHKQHYRIIDFKRDKEGIAGQGRADRIRSEPHRAHRAAVLRRRRAPLHHRAEGPEGRRPGDLGPRCADQGRQHPAAAQHPGRFDRALHRDEAGQGRAARACCRRRRAAGRPRRRLRDAPPAFGRDAQGAGRLPRDHRRSRQRRAQPREAGQGRCASAGAASSRPCAARP